MKYLLILLILLLCSCVTVENRTIDPETGKEEILTISSGGRKITVATENFTVIAGAVAIDPETARVLIKEAAPSITPVDGD